MDATGLERLYLETNVGDRRAHLAMRSLTRLPPLQEYSLRTYTVSGVDRWLRDLRRSKPQIRRKTLRSAGAAEGHEDPPRVRPQRRNAAKQESVGRVEAIDEPLAPTEPREWQRHN